jgi:hypothetical protein
MVRLYETRKGKSTGRSYACAQGLNRPRCCRVALAQWRLAGAGQSFSDHRRARIGRSPRIIPTSFFPPGERLAWQAPPLS